MHPFARALSVSALILSFPAHAGFEGTIEFTPEERLRHEQGVDAVVSEAALCLNEIHGHHASFFKQHGVSPYYGEGSAFARKSESGQRRELRKKGVSEDLLEQMKPTSCIGMALDCLGRGFTKAGQGDFWARIKKFTQANGVGGLALQHGLQALGWKLLYWTPDVRRFKVRAIYEAREDPGNKRRFWGMHEEFFKAVQERGVYLYNKVDDARLLLNFGPQVPAALVPVPFFLGTAHGGYHVFPGSLGRVIEAHSLVDIDDPRTIDSSPFNPMESQGPTEGMFFSGLVAVPAKFAR